MSTIIYDARRIKAFEALSDLCKYTGEEEAFLQTLWEGLLIDNELMKEFIYYLDHHAILDQIRCEGYTLTDLYVWGLKKYNFFHDTGKNTRECDKERLVLETFYHMVQMKNNPEEYRKWLDTDDGMDRF